MLKMRADERALKLSTDDSDAFFIACTQLPTRSIIDTLKGKLKRPVWSATRATAWAALRELELDAKPLAA